MERETLNRALAWLELCNDRVFNKIPPEKYRYYLDNAPAAGDRAAAQCAGKPIRQLYAENQIEIVIKQSDGLFFTVQFRAQFEYSEKQALRRVTLYQPSLESLQTSCARMGLSMSLEQIIDIHLAHEFFHFLEHHQQQPVGATLDTVCHFSLGPLRSYSTVSSTSEIAAHRFCQRMQGLEYYPTWYDFLWLIHNGRQTRQETDHLFAQAATALQEMA